MPAGRAAAEATPATAPAKERPAGVSAEADIGAVLTTASGVVTVANVKRHEQSTRHLENARQQLKDAYQRHQEKEKHERMLERELQQMEAAAAAAMRKDEAQLTSRGAGGPPRGLGPSAYEQLQAQREEKARIQQFYDQRNSQASGAAQAAVDTVSQASSSSNNGDAWEFVTDQGLPFFRNKITGEVSWTPPPGASYLAASAAATAAAAAVPAAVAAASAATTAAAPSRPTLRILSVKKPVKKEQPGGAAPVSPPTAAASNAAAPTAAAPTGAAPTAAAPTTPAGSERPMGGACAGPAAAVVKSAASESSPTNASIAPAHAARTASAPDTRDWVGVAADAPGADAPAAAGAPVSDAASLPVKCEMPDFIPSNSSRTNSGSSAIPAGYVFKNGHRGLGFYRDRPLQQHRRHQDEQQRRGPCSRPLQHQGWHAQQQQQRNTQQIQQHKQNWQQQQQQHMQHERQRQKELTTPCKRPREEADGEAVSPPVDAAAAIAAAAAEAAAAAATLWGSGEPATEGNDSISRKGGTAACAIEAEEGLTGAPADALRGSHRATADENDRVANDDSRISDERSGGDSDSSEESEGETEDSTDAAAAGEPAAATSQRQVVHATEGPVIGPWVEAKEDGWDAIARRQKQEQEQLLALQQQQEEALEHDDERQVNAGVEQLRRLRAQVKRRGVHHDFSWQKDVEAEYSSCSNGSSSTSGQSIEIRNRQRPAASRQQQETE
ncbi:ww domain U1 zinc finger domain-containing protein, putative [Eimeria mitis]|uniref:Ww domain U1 zinc finger domain-containing protein, putative n=1 Tax=Eimeria mitis TaxID=44415 RepID=U6JX84_9EIME|nr:ww domain U1 zinc finger domain-containing protein, putative [Eimeria mitis]CDJ28138.1 ww domain U1 zinc finger domain-containing protein, putative [Eimeria mitis]